MDALPLTEMELVEIGLSPEEAAPLLDSGIVPGCSLCRVRATPSGDTVVSADGVCFALRKETARLLWVKPQAECDLRKALDKRGAASQHEASGTESTDSDTKGELAPETLSDENQGPATPEVS